MSDDTSVIKGIEQGRAKFAYECANQVVNLKDFDFDSKSITVEYVKKLFHEKFKNDTEVKGNDGDEKKAEKAQNKRILEEFVNEPQKFLNQKRQEVEKEGNFKRKLPNFYQKTLKEYKSYVKKVPMYIKTNGFGATFAFVKSKGGTYDLISHQITEWLKYEPKGLISQRLKEGEDLGKVIISLNSPEYRALTIEILAFFNWLRRFAEGLIEEE